MHKAGAAHARQHSVTGRTTSVASAAEKIVGEFRCCCCRVSGNAVSLMTSAFLFSLITSVQYFFALIANSKALQADCVSMAVDAVAFMGNLFAECMPKDSVLGKRRVELTMSGLSHILLLGFTISFIFEGWNDAHVDCATDETDVNGYIVLTFALCGLLFDVISLLSYKYYGFDHSGDADETNKAPSVRSHQGTLADDLLPGNAGYGYSPDDTPEGADELTCGINTNMCAALLHVLSDLMRSTTTLIESLVIIFISDKGGSMCSTKADGISTLAVCSIIVVGATGALLTWLREVFIYVTAPVVTKRAALNDDRLFGNSPLHANQDFA